jgi:hypothetical protein
LRSGSTKLRDSLRAIREISSFSIEAKFAMGIPAQRWAHLTESPARRMCTA